MEHQSISNLHNTTDCDSVSRITALVQRVSQDTLNRSWDSSSFRLQRSEFYLLKIYLRNRCASATNPFMLNILYSDLPRQCKLCLLIAFQCLECFASTLLGGTTCRNRTTAFLLTHNKLFEAIGTLESHLSTMRLHSPRPYHSSTDGYQLPYTNINGWIRI